MKHMKKIASLLLALVMIFALAVTAFADGEGESDPVETGSITIENSVTGETYDIYLMFKLESYDATKNLYAYKITDAWEDFVGTGGAGATYFTADAQGYVTVSKSIANDSEEAAALAKAALAYAKDKSLTPVATLPKDGSYTATGLTLGYYLVDSSLGALCSVDTTNPTATVREKNVAPGNEKEVEEDSKTGTSGAWGKTNDADIGQTVNFRSTITAQAGAQNYVFHDKMSEGLTYTADSVKVYLNPKLDDNGNIQTEATPINADENYTLTASTTDGDTFDVTFTETFCKNLKANDKIVITYSATVNDKAVVGGEGNKNESKLSYGDEGKSSTTPSETITYTWDVDVFKYTKDGETENPLAGATFTLSKSDDGSNPINLIREKDENDADTNTYRVAKSGETGAVTEITTDGTGKFTIKGLDADTYWLIETAAPAGYNKVSPIAFTIADKAGSYTEEGKEGSESYEQGATLVKGVPVEEIKVLNQSGNELPSTGGIGTTIFYVLGGILVVGAVIVLVTKRRMSADK